MAAGRFNEGKAVDAVIRRIEAREGCPREDDGRSPEADGHDAPVEFVCTIGGQLFAFEHTGIEPFPDQIQMEVDNDRLFGPLRNVLVGALPLTDYFQLIVPVDAARGLKASRCPRVRKALADWITATAPSLISVPLGGSYRNPPLGETIDGVPFPTSVHRWSIPGPELPQRFGIAYMVKDGLEAARQTRLREVCERKFPKLAAWKLDRGARTVLVLEDRDIQLTNHQLVYDALTQAEEGRDDAPDEVFLVSTFLEDRWWVTCLRRCRASYYDDGERFAEIDPGTLVSLTHR
jgi:hypothetical protein